MPAIFGRPAPEKRWPQIRLVAGSPTRLMYSLSRKCPVQNTAKGKLFLDLTDVFFRLRRYNGTFPLWWTRRLPDRFHHRSMWENGGRFGPGIWVGKCDVLEVVSSSGYQKNQRVLSRMTCCDPSEKTAMPSTRSFPESGAASNALAPMERMPPLAG